MPFDPADHLDASLDFSEDVAAAARHTHLPFPFGYPPATAKTPLGNSATTSGFLKHLERIDVHDKENMAPPPPLPPTTTNMRRRGAGGGGYSPPAWRRLGNGDRSSGFWRKGGDDLLLGYNNRNGGRRGEFDYDSAEDDDLYGDSDDEDEILAAAIRTRLPTGSMSPEKERSPEPEYSHYAAQGGYGQQQQQARYRSASRGANLGRGGDAPRIKSEEPDAEDMRATLAAVPAQNEGERGREREADNCAFWT